jgi:hypothetical protein
MALVNRRSGMWMSLAANPVPAELYQFVRGGSSATWLPWYIWGGGVVATKYGYNTSNNIGYLGTVSVPLSGNAPVIFKTLRMTGVVNGKQGANEGAMVLVRLWQRTANTASPIATILVDRRNVVVSNVYVDVSVSAGNFAASPTVHSLAIEIIGEGQGIATIHGLFVEYQ